MLYSTIGRWSSIINVDYGSGQSQPLIPAIETEAICYKRHSIPKDNWIFTGFENFDVGLHHDLPSLINGFCQILWFSTFGVVLVPKDNWVFTGFEDFYIGMHFVSKLLGC
jgi:hypothetical protein